MKTCPVCKAQAFDDAEVCYGCLYRFEWSDAAACPSRSSETADGCFEDEDGLFFEDPDPPRRGLDVSGGVAGVQPLLTVPAHTVVAQGSCAGDRFAVSLPATLVIQLQVQQSAIGSCAP